MISENIWYLGEYYLSHFSLEPTITLRAELILSNSGAYGIFKILCRNLKIKYKYFKGFESGLIQMFVVESLSHVWTFCNPIDSSLPGSSVYRTFQARILSELPGKNIEWVANSFSRASSWPNEWIHDFCIGRQILYHWVTWAVTFKYKHLSTGNFPSLSLSLFPSSLPSLSPSSFLPCFL